jgi:hypothetical protein
VTDLLWEKSTAGWWMTREATPRPTLRMDTELQKPKPERLHRCFLCWLNKD